MIVLNRGDFAGLMVESAADNQRQLTKPESRENDTRPRDLWWEKSNVQAFCSGMIIATGGVNMRGCKHFVKGITFCGDRDVQIS